MDITELKDLAHHTRSSRERGYALLMASGVLALLLFVPLSERMPKPAQETQTVAQNESFTRAPIRAHAAIVYDLATRETLFAKEAEVQLPLASLTKLLTVYTALTSLASSTPITISAEAARLEPPRLFSVGQTIRLHDLARLTLTASLNDGASAILETVAAHTQREKTALLAGAAAGLSLSQTYAVNGSGLDVTTTISGGYGSAHDLAILAGALLDTAPDIALATTQPVARAQSLTGTKYTVSNTDPIVSTIPHILLSKTGYTDLAQGNLVVVFDVGIGHPIAVVVLGSTKEARFTDVSALVAATYAHFAHISTL